MASYRTLRAQLAAPAMVLGGLLLVPWILYLAGTLPHTTRARNWSLMWSGLDIAEALGLVVTGVLLWRRSAYRALPAAVTAALLAADAWIDVTTSAPGHARTLAILMAAVIEVPAAVGCLVLAIRAFPRVPAGPVPPAHHAGRPAPTADPKSAPSPGPDAESMSEAPARI